MLEQAHHLHTASSCILPDSAPCICPRTVQELQEQPRLLTRTESPLPLAHPYLGPQAWLPFQQVTPSNRACCLHSCSVHVSGDPIAATKLNAYLRR